MPKKENKEITNDLLEEVVDSLEKSNDIQEEQLKEEKKTKGDSYFKKAIKDQVSVFKDVIKPGNLLKSLTLAMGSPTLLFIGDKIGELTENFIAQRQESKEQFKKANKDSFLNEKIKDEEIKQRKRTNELLEDQISVTKENKPEKDKKTKLLEFLKSPLESIKTALTGGTAGLLAGGKGAIAGLGKLAKGVLGKIALPLAAILGLVDFSKGFSNALEITGDDNSFKGKFLAGISKAISGFTFGLVDPKTIYKGANFVIDKIKDIILKPFALLKDFIKGNISLSDAISSEIENLTFGFIDKSQVKDLVDFFITKFKNLILAPFRLIGDIIKGKSLSEVAKEALSNISFGLFSFDDLKTTAAEIKDYFGEIFIDGKNRLVNFFKNFVFSDFIDTLFGEGVVDTISGFFSKKLGIVKNNLLEKYNDLKNLISAPFVFASDLLLNIEDKIIQLGDAIGQKKDQFLNLIASPFESLSSLFDGSIIENIADKIGSVKSKITSFIDNIKNKFGNILDLIRSPISLISGIFDKFNIFKNNETDLLKNKQLSLNDQNLNNISTSQKENNNVMQERMKYDKLKRDIDAKNRETQAQALTNIIQTNNSAVVLPEDMRTNTDDATFNLFAPEGAF